MIKRIQEYRAELLAFIAFVVYAGILNLQFLEGSNINYTFSGHDEYLTVREVYSILNPASFKHFALALSAGDVMFYGRAMFYTDALVAWLPYKIWGLEGMVYAIRMAHVLYLVLGVILLGRTFLSKAFSRLLFYLVVLTWYYTAYFVMIPKPEPLQLLVLAIFLFYAQRAKWQYGKHFIWLGIAYGLKFNVLMILPLCFAAPFFTGTFKLKEAIISGLMLLAGIVMAVPSLILSPLRPIYIQTYLRSTFGNTSHYDDTGVSFADWLNKGLFHWYGGHSISGAIIFLAFLALVAWFAYRLLLKKELNAVVVMLAIGFCFLMPVMLLTKRLWPHYLWTGSVFMILGLIMFSEKEWQFKGMKNMSRIILAPLLLIVFFSLTKTSPLFSLELNAASELEKGKSVHSYIRSKNPKAKILQEISIYYPFSDFVVAGRYHPFKEPSPYQRPESEIRWNDMIRLKDIQNVKPDFLVMAKREQSLVLNTFRKVELAKNDSLLNSKVGEVLFRDTLYKEFIIYRVVNQ